MYIRRVSRKNKDGSKVTYVQLAHNVWDSEAKCSKTEVIYSFGREDTLDIDSLRRLVSSISRVLSPEEASEIQAGFGQGEDFLFHSSRALGGSWVLDKLWKELEMDKILEGVFSSKNKTDLERLIFAMVANRALDPSSKLAMEEWISTVHIENLESVQSQQLYRAMDDLLDVKSELEERVYWSVANLLNLEDDLLYFDTTSPYFEVEPSQVEDDFRLKGFSKDKRADLLQVVIGLAVTREGIPIRSWVWPGNTSDISVVEEVKRDLNGWKLGRVISVMDRGFSSEENLRYLQRAGGHYIVGEKMRSGKGDTEEALSRKGRYSPVRDNLHLKEIIVGEGEARKRYVLVYNPQEAKREKAKRDEITKNLTEELKSLKQLPSQAHTKAACKLRANPVYGKYIQQLKDGRLKLNKSAIEREERYDGKYLIRTSDDTLSSEDVALGYKQLVDVENAFRTLKTTLELRPMYHRKEERIRSHIFLCWLALLLVRIAERRTGMTWSKIRNELERIQLGHFSVNKNEVHKSTELTVKQREILSKLKVETPPTYFEIQQNT